MRSMFLAVGYSILSGCAYSIVDIDTSHSEATCVRQCSNSYSNCASSGNQVGFKTETLRACREAYSVCISTCPPKDEKTGVSPRTQ